MPKIRVQVTAEYEVEVSKEYLEELDSMARDLDEDWIEVELKLRELVEDREFDLCNAKYFSYLR